MILFFIYETTIFVILFIHYIYGLNIKYGCEFGRKILVFDKAKNKYDYIVNNGTYIVENGQIVQ